MRWGHPQFGGHPLEGASAAQEKIDGTLAKSGVVGGMGFGHTSSSFCKPCALPVHRIGGISPAARRRVHALVDERLQADGCSPLAVDELARAAGLSVHHFIKAFRQTEGGTPHAKVIARRLDHALSLLLQANARVDWIALQTGFSSPRAFRERLPPALGHHSWRTARRRYLSRIRLTESHDALAYRDVHLAGQALVKKSIRLWGAWSP